MSFNLRDMMLTAYALGELDDAERRDVEAQLASDPSARAELQRMQAVGLDVTHALTGEAEQGLSDLHRLAIESRLQHLDAADRHHSIRASRRKQWRWLATTAAASVLLVVGIGAAAWFAEQVRVSRNLGNVATSPVAGSGNSALPLGSSPVLAMDVSTVPATPRPRYAPVMPAAEREPAAFVSPAAHPLSTFSLHVGRESYQHVRDQLASGRLPQPTNVHIEQLINAFDYQDARPSDREGNPFQIHSEVNASPWHHSHRLIRIALSARGGKGEHPVARDVRLFLEFNPAKVAGYRLIGFESPQGPDSPPPTVEQLGQDLAAGHRVTALFEVIPADTDAGTADLDTTLRYQQPARLTEAAFTDELLFIRVDYRDPDSGGDADAGGDGDAEAQVERMQVAVHDAGRMLRDASFEYRFTASVAGVGMLLRNSPMVGRSDYHDMLALVADLDAQTELPELERVRRDTFIALVKQAAALSLPRG